MKVQIPSAASPRASAIRIGDPASYARAVRAIREVSRPHGFNVGLNLGGVAGGSLAAHLHQHVVPRWSGDANFIAVISHTKIIPQLLATPARYIGVMGSKRRWSATRERLLETGVQADEIDRVHVPIGIDIGAETVEEIAGLTPELSTGGGTSDGRFISPAGADVVELGPVNASIHKVNEHVNVSDVIRLTDMYRRIMEILL